jgi:hypothetical protein
MTPTFKDLDMVQLLVDHPAAGLRKGSVGCIVHDYADGRTFEVEFTELHDTTMPIVTLTADQLAPWVGTEKPKVTKVPPQAAE